MANAHRESGHTGRCARTRFSLIPHAASLIVALMLLSACGFHPRGTATLPFDTLYVEAPVGSLFAQQLRRVIGAGSKTRVTDTPIGADATLRLLHELREKEILSLSAGGRVREFQLRYRVQYQVSGTDKAVIVPPSEIVLRRDFSFNDQDQLSKEAEEALLYRDMQSDAVQQLVRRLQVVKAPQKG